MSAKMMAPVVIMMMMIVGVMKVSCSLNATTNLTLSAVLAPDDFHLSWAFDSDQIVLEARVRTRGWVGLGLSSTGMMAGSDVVIGWVDSAAATHLVDAHIEMDRSLVRDASQDYKLVGLSENGTHTVMRVVRALRTYDANDRNITEDTVRLIWAYSTDDPKSENVTDVPYHSAATRGSKSIQLLRQGFPTEQPLPQNYSTFDVVQSQFLIPPVETNYVCNVMQLPNLTKKHHLIKVQPLVQAGNTRFVHHMIVYACETNVNMSYINTTFQCYSSMGATNHPSARCLSVLAAWAVGGETFDYPADAGYSLGMDADPKVVMLEMHYNNPQAASGVSDSSGLRLYYTPNLRKYDTGILETGILPNIYHFIPPKTTSFTSYGICNTRSFVTANSNDTLQGQVSGTMNVFATMLHSHLAGIAIQVRHFRNGNQIGNLGRDMGYDFGLQETRYLNNLTAVLPGDQVVTECTYRTTTRTVTTTGGLGTMNEMCLSFLYYYPKVNIGLCRSMYDITTVAPVMGFTLNSQWPYYITSPQAFFRYFLFEIYDVIPWTEQLVCQVESAARNATQYVSSLNDLFPILSVEKIPKLPTDPTAQPCSKFTISTAKGSAPEMNAALTTLLPVLLLHLMGTALLVA
uniref:DBH-like monooxygenase protein 1 homolog n=1 Tax=Petromyzon marinus TaxID=7757 RepID=A0AAJ7X183_PETMA|nr:DBH-like monooxygenase protein 1 homolog [Petromyzon marinus]